MEFLIPELIFFVFGLLTGALVSWLFQYLASKKSQFDYEDLLLEREQDLHSIEELEKDKKAYEDKFVKLENNYAIANQLLKEENNRAQVAEKKLKEEHVRIKSIEQKFKEEHVRIQKETEKKLKVENSRLQAEITKKEPNTAIQTEVAQRLKEEKAQLEEFIKKLNGENSHLKTELEQKLKEETLRTQNTEQKIRALELELIESKERERAAVLTNKNDLQVLLKQQKEENAVIRASFKEEFAQMTNQLLEEKSHDNQQNLGALLEPLNQKIKDFESEVKATHLKDSEQSASIMEQFKQLSELNQQMSQEAQNLTKALKGDKTHKGGNWGEMVLEKILEKSGLVKGQEYEIQKHFNAIKGNACQPDVIINLPQNRHIVIDSKVSLAAYERYNAVEDSDETTEVLKEHLLSIAKHIKQLNSKNYHHLYQLKTLDFVLLFVPIEGAFSLAIQQDADLFNTAFENNIILVSPTTLLATLRTVANIWQQEKQTRNALEIVRKSGDLYDKFVGFAENLQGHWSPPTRHRTGV